MLRRIRLSTITLTSGEERFPHDLVAPTTGTNREASERAARTTTRR
jgi:hypothetical protein